MRGGMVVDCSLERMLIVSTASLWCGGSSAGGNTTITVHRELETKKKNYRNTPRNTKYQIKKRSIGMCFSTSFCFAYSAVVD